MGTRSLHLALFSICLIFSSGLRISYGLGTQLDDVPIVNPTTPGTENPNPSTNPTYQAPDTTGQNPTTPNTNPTTPTTNTNPTTPTTNTNPTTPTTTPTSSSGGQWCVAKQGASDTTLQVALDYACGYGGADCSAIQPGASCYEPNTVRDHASYAFNQYFQKNPVPTSCDFGGTATLSNNDPSTGNCHWASPTSTSTSTPPPPTDVIPPPATYESPPSPATTMTPTPPDMTMPGGSSVYGSEPTESPNAATTAFSSLLLLVACSLLVPLQLANFI
ncbi:PLASMODESMATA CALLOSE-BINDING PROTEIN 3-like [Arachis stenosperma]|uniref:PLASMODESMATA CALLOSE-BINDING PROTEIN 3-like n=1 Tax=Arachis stenosperma TaxID=217475 RepID=UPI0025ABBAF3|nr:PLASMODESMATA CALLOSE-BINDING PROTEIN 3-like [Arachis stenosperma]